LMVAGKMFSIHQERTADHQENEIASQPIFRLPKSYHPEGLRQHQLLGLEPQTLEIRPPEILTKFTETIGRALLREARRICFAAQKEIAPSENQLPVSSEISKAVPIFIPEIRIPTDEDRARWKASQEAHELIESRNKLLAEFQVNHPTINFNNVPVAKSIFSFATTKSAEEASELDATKEPINEDEQKLEAYSTTSFAAKKNQRSESVYSHSTAKTRSSLASSRDSHLSGASAMEKQRFQAADKEVSKAADAWIDLVRRADAERVVAGGLEYANDETLFKAWQETDEKAQDAEKEQIKIEEEFLRAERIKHDWEEDTMRWEAREKADRLAYELEMAKFDIAAVTTGSNASAYVEKIKESLKAAKQEWTQLALMFHGSEPSKAQTKQLKEKDRAINKLWEKIKHPQEEELDSIDRKSALNQGVGAYQIDLMLQKGKDIADCFEKADKANLKVIETQKKVSRRQATQEEVERLYEEADQLEQKAVEKYTKIVMKVALRAAWEKVTGAESAWESRVTKAQRDTAIAKARLPKPAATIPREAAKTEEIRVALQLSKLIADTDANSAEPQSQLTFANVGEFLNHKIDENIFNERRAAIASKTLLARATAEDHLLRAQTSAEALLKTSQEAEERKNPLYQAATRLASIAAADQNAFESFKREAKEITDIVATWKTELEIEEKAAPLNLLIAALSYAENKTPWELLIPHERKNYNEAVVAAN
ncbi:MAG: hypothetical protein WCO92_05330, partial [Verrucomicrobiota bacterium]